MAVDWLCGERERLANDFSVHDVRRLLADPQSSCHALSLELKLEHEWLPGDRGAFPSAIPRSAGVLAGERCAGKARCVPQERHINGRRERVRRTTDRDRDDCPGSFHLTSPVQTSSRTASCPSTARWPPTTSRGFDA